ncbi:MAG: hypothetical protein CM15mV42_0580 [uncultured marine virus]|nr:MAG: hypothetical protein CM15mV42_0580 [uncultured marine virus]
MATGGSVSYIGYDVAALVNDGVSAAVPGGYGGGWRYDIDGSELKETPNAALILTSLLNFSQQFAVGTNEMIEMMYNLVSAEDFALKYNSNGFYGGYAAASEVGAWRSKNNDSNYIGSVFQNFGDVGQFKINNLFRPKTIAVLTNDALDNPTVGDDSRFVLGNSGQGNGIYKDTGIFTLKRTCSALYVH